MTSDEELFARQAAWQKSRQTLSWLEKIRQAARMRSSIEALRKERQRHQGREPFAPGKTG